MTLSQYTSEDFIRESLSGRSGSAELLVSQSLIAHYTDGATLTGSQYHWPYIESSSAMVWNSASFGSVSPGFITGVKVMFLDNTGENNRRSFQVCNSLSLTISTGGIEQTLVLDIQERQLTKDYAYFKVKAYPLAAISNVAFTFTKDTNGNFSGYTCNASSDGSPITLVVEPYYSAIEGSVFDPLLNNVVNGVKSSIARVVESNKGTAYMWDITRIINGAYANGFTTSSIIDSETVFRSGSYNKRIFGPIAIPSGGRLDAYVSGTFSGTVVSGTFSGSYNDTVYSGSMAGEVSGTLNGMFSVTSMSGYIDANVSGTITGSYYDGGSYDGGMSMFAYPTSTSLTVLAAEIPDYFYTALASISSRFLGSKTGYELKTRKSRQTDSGSGITGSNTIKEFISNYTGKYVTVGEMVSSSVGEYTASVRKLSEDTLNLLADHLSLLNSFSIQPSSQSNLDKELSYSEVGVDPAFFAAQEFFGSVYSIDAENIPDIKDMEFSTLKFAPGTVYEVAELSGSSTTLYRRTYNRVNTVSTDSGSTYHDAVLPGIGDVLYAEGLDRRLVNSKVFVQETSYVLLTNEFGSVREVQSGSEG